MRRSFPTTKPCVLPAPSVSISTRRWSACWCEKKGSDLLMWDSGRRAAKGALGAPDGSRGMIDAVHHAAHIGRSRTLQAAREMLVKTGVDEEPMFFTALEAVLEVLPVSKAFSGIDLEGDLAAAGSDFEALENLRKLAFTEQVDAPKQLELWQEPADCMTILQDRAWKLKYTPDHGDLVKLLYQPMLECAVRYDRLTGYFSASALALAARGIEGLIVNGGQMRMVVGCTLDPPEVEAIEKGEALRTQVRSPPAATPLCQPIASMAEALELLAWLMAMAGSTSVSACRATEASSHSGRRYVPRESLASPRTRPATGLPSTAR